MTGNISGLFYLYKKMYNNYDNLWSVININDILVFPSSKKGIYISMNEGWSYGMIN